MFADYGICTMRYDYICHDCKGMFDISLTVAEYEKVKEVFCPTCKTSNTKRTFMNIPVVAYRGEGFTLKVKEESDDNTNVSHD